MIQLKKLGKNNRKVGMVKIEVLKMKEEVWITIYKAKMEKLKLKINIPCLNRGALLRG